MSFRDRTHGLLLSEWGGYMDGLGQGGGTKRLSTLIHHHGWKAKQIDAFLLRRADERIVQWEARGEEGLLIWDATVLEKPESLKAEGLCAVRSSKALRLTRVKKGDSDAIPDPTNVDYGWIYKPLTGEIVANSTGSDASGTAYKNY